MAYEKIALSDIKKIDIINTKGMTAQQVYEKYKPDYILNGALYDVDSKTNIVNLVDEKVSSGYLFSNNGIGIVGENKVVWCDKGDKSIRDFIAGAPTLVVNGKKNIDWGNKKSDYINGSHKRSVIGFSGTHLYLLASDHDNTIDGVANYCVEHGVTHAINLDGGGSCHLQKGNTVIKKSTRANVSWILVYLKEKIVYDVTKSNRDIKSLQPLAQKAAQLFLDTCKSRGIDIFVTEYQRSQARQNYLYEQGRTRPGQIVTWTRTSNHTSGYAWDIAVNPPKDLYDRTVINKAGAVAKELGIEWGGTWSTPDTPHFQIDKNWKEPVKEDGQHLKQDECIVVIDGKESIGKLIDGSSYVPARWVSENLGYKVEWDSKTKIVTIKK